MSYMIFEVKREDTRKIDQVIRDDIISRQSITIRDASSLDMKKDITFVKIEGSDEAIKRAETLFREIGVKKIGKKDADLVNEKITSQDDSAAEGMGMIFD